MTATHDEIHKYYRAIRNLFKQGEIDELTYYKMTIGFAADFAILGCIDDAVGLLIGVPPDYYLKAQEEHLSTDDSYREKVLFLTQELVRCNKVRINNEEDDELMYRVMLRTNTIGKA